MEFRNHYPAFNGAFKVHKSPDTRRILSWEKRKYGTSAFIGLEDYRTRITYYDPVAGRDVEFAV